MDPELRKLLDELNSTFAAFRKLNDERWDKLQKGEGVDALLNLAVDRSNKAVSDLTTKIRDVQTKLAEQETVIARRYTHMDSGMTDIEAAHARTYLAFTRGQTAESLDVSDEDLKTYRAFRRAQNAYLRQGNVLMQKPGDIRDALSTGAAPGGGIWVTPDISGRMIKLVYQSSPIRSMAAQQSIGTDTLQGFNDLDEAASGWVGEIDARAETATPAAQGMWAITMQEQYANPRITQKMMDDTSFDVEGWLANKVSRKMARTENTGFVSGNGVLKPRGFTTYPFTSTAPTKTAWSTIQQIKTGVNNDFAATNKADIFLDLIASMKVEYRGGSALAMSTVTLAAIRKFKDGQGNYLFYPSFFNGAATPPAPSALPSNAGVDNEVLGKVSPSGQIFGYNVYEFVDLPDYNDTTGGGLKRAVYFANWPEFYQIIDHTVGVRVLRDPYTGKPYVSFYTTKRTGGDVINFEAAKAIQFSA
jgi:HK97 family phage major capsid protein